MELGLSLGETSKTVGGIMENTPYEASNKMGLSFSTTLSIGPVGAEANKQAAEDNPRKGNHSHDGEDMSGQDDSLSPKPTQLPLQLDLLPHTPVVLPRTSNLPLSFTWPPSSENGDQEEGEDGPAVSSSPNNSAASSFQMDLCIYSKGLNQNGKRESDGEGCDQRASSRASDEDDNSGTRKKLRLSKEQSAFLEESFKEHSTLNPKQKLALAKQLGLRPRQVEVWFQNRRARTKLKQTEVDCEYLKRCCEALTEENRRLHKELQELRALKTSNPFYMQLPATTLTMCPSCERVATNSTSAASSNTPSTTNTNGACGTTTTHTTKDPIFNTNIGFPLSRPKFYPFAHT